MIEWIWPRRPHREEPSTARVHTSAGLRDLLAAIRSEAETRQIAIAVSAATPKSDVFTVVLGVGGGSIVTYDGRGGDPPDFVSVGDPRKDLSLVSYFFGGELSEPPASHVILEEVAVNALIDSIQKEQPSSLIEWFGG